MTQRPCRRAAVNRVRRLCFQHREVMSPVQRHPGLPPGLQVGCGAQEGAKAQDEVPGSAPPRWDSVLSARGGPSRQVGRGLHRVKTKGAANKFLSSLNPSWERW